MMTASSKPLEGIRILDLSRILAGPWCSMLLGDLGADVIKVERPGRGDDTRAWGPPFVGPESAYYLSVNRNKRSVCLDLKEARGLEIAQGLAARSDVVLQNFAPGVVDRLGLGYEALSALNPRLVYCSLSAFGLDGPYVERKGYDALVQAMGGLMSITGEPDGPPTKVGVAVTDVLAGLYAKSGILAALWERERSGRGQHVDVALLDSLVASLVNQTQSYLVTGEAPGRLGSAHPSIVPYQPFEAADGSLLVAVGNDAQFAALCGLLGRPELATDPRFVDNAARVASREVLVGLLGEVFRTRELAHWVGACEEAGVPAGPVQDLAATFADPQLRHRGVVVEVDHPTAGRLPMVANPIRMSRSELTVDRPPPTLGQHTDEVLAEVLGLSEVELAGLRRDGVIA